jgi:putative transposase
MASLILKPLAALALVVQHQPKKGVTKMANTYSQIYIQVVFAVQGRQCLIQPAFKEEVYKYMTGIVTKQEQKMLQINGVADHVHLLIGLKPSIALSDLVRDIKAGSSKFINEQGWMRGKFHWQEGFGAFSYGHSQLDTVIRYIQDQEIHHQQKSFKNEYLGLCATSTSPLKTNTFLISWKMMRRWLYSKTLLRLRRSQMFIELRCLIF